MPPRNRNLLKTLLPLGIVAMLFAIVRRLPDDWEYHEVEQEPQGERPSPRSRHLAAPIAVRSRGGTRRLGLATTFTVLFFAGAAFTAGAGDQAAQLLEGDTTAVEAAATEATAPESVTPEPAPELSAEDALAPEAPAPEAVVPEATEPEAPAAEAAPQTSPEAAAPEAAIPAEAAPAETAPAEAAPAEAAPAEAAPAEAAPAEASAAADTAAGEATPAPTATEAAGSSGPGNLTSAAPAPRPAAAAAAAPKRTPARRASTTKKWVVKRAAEKPAQTPEIEHEGHDDGQATVWLNRALPDPTPASARLRRPFARQLLAASKHHGVDWAGVLAVLRAQGERGSSPASARELDVLAARLAKANVWKGALALSGRTGFADRAAALADLYRFVGIEALVTGYTAAKDRLAKKVLNAPGIFIYDGGRQDIVRGRIDVRVLALIGYLAQRHDGVTVSSLFSGHRTFSRPGVVSAHSFGHAVDVAAVGGTPILGNQQPGGLTEAAVRSVLLLPTELQPRQVISLLGLGGPSFPMRDHGDHIHVGY